MTATNQNPDQKNQPIGQRCVCNGLRRAARAVTRLYDGLLAPSGLRTTQFSILAALYAAGPIALGKLADRLVTERTTLTRNLSLLETRGLILTVNQTENPAKNGEDQRQRRIALTPEGREALEAALPHWERAQAFMRERLGEDRLESLLREFSDVVNAAGSDAAKEDAPPHA